MTTKARFCDMGVCDATPERLTTPEHLTTQEHLP